MSCCITPSCSLRDLLVYVASSFNCQVILQTSQAYARYIEAQARTAAGDDAAAADAAVERVHEQGLVLGYDGRHRSRRFAEICASAFLAAGFRVHLFSRMVATPFVPFGLLHLKAAAGVVITASHNPKDDNGELATHSSVDRTIAEVADLVSSQCCCADC